MRDALIVDAVRTPIGCRGGALSVVHPAVLSAHVLTSLVERTGLDPSTVDEVVWGCVSQFGEQDGNIGRTAILAAGWPSEVPGTTLTHACGSSQQSVSFAATSVMSGRHELVVAGGVEVMPRVPTGSANADGEYARSGVLKRFDVAEFQRGMAAEMIAERWGFTRTALDEYALRSHALSAEATDAGAFEGQLAPIDGLVLAHDEGVRRDGTLETLGKLKPVFKEDGVIHAGNSSQISDGAGALLITTSEYAASHGWSPLARIRTSVVTSGDPVLMLTGPMVATAKALERSALSIDEIGAFEINEAFAPVPLAWQAETGADLNLLNPVGGAIGVGHPLGGSEMISLTRMAHHMRDNGIRYGLQSTCEVGEMANAVILELL